MSILSMLAFRMVTQEGLHKCLRIYEELNKSAGEKAAEPSTTLAVTRPDMHDTKSPSRSARRRIRRRKLQESKRGEGITATATRQEKLEKKDEGVEEEEEGTIKSRENGGDDEDVDVGSYNLVTHRDRRTGKDFLERSLMAAFLLKCLQRVGFFAHPTADDGTYHIGCSLSHGCI